MSNIVLVLAGQIGAGKSTSAKYLSSRYDARHLSFVETIWLPLLAERGQEPTRHNLQVLGIELMRDLGATGLVDRLLEHMQPEANYLIDDVRSPVVYEYLHSRLPGAKLVFLKASLSDRFPRLEIRDGVTSLEEQQNAELVETEIAINDLQLLADFTVQNAGSEIALYAALDKVAASCGLRVR